MAARQCTCPGCGKSISYQEAWEGKRGKCLACGAVMTFAQAPEEFIPNIRFEGDEPAASPAGRSGPRNTVAPASLRNSPRPSLRTARRDYTAVELFFLKTGITTMVMGVLSFFLPYFGLQFRKLATLGDHQTTGGIILLILGGLMAGLAAIRPYTIPKAIKRAVFWGIVSILGLALTFAIVLTTIGFVTINSRPGARPEPSVAVPPAAQPMGASFGAGWEKARSQGEVGELVFVGVTNMNRIDLSKKIVALLSDKGYGTGVSMQSQGDEIRARFYPATDVTSLVKRLGIGTRHEIDEAKKEARIYF